MSDPAALVRAASQPLAVVPTGWKPKLAPLAGIRAVALDLYGTLLISGADGTGSRPDAGDAADKSADNSAGETRRDDFEGRFWDSVRLEQERRRVAGTEFPEVEVREIWSRVWRDLGRPPLAPKETERALLEHQCRVNPVWPMPGAAALLASLRRRGLVFGIISNAQFYTRPVLEALLGDDLDGLGFHRDLRVFSYELGEGKPSPRLFERFLEGAAALGIRPGEILHLGNDYHKDVLPARAAGFRTGLFAGDARSLRLGGVSPETARASADAVVTELAQVPDLLQ